MNDHLESVGLPITDVVGDIDLSLEELRHAPYGFFGPGLRSWFRRAAGLALSPVQYRLLRLVEASDPDLVTLDDVTGALLVDRARASRLVSELVRAGLVRRKIEPLDRRRRMIELVDGGREALSEARRVRTGFIADALEGWSPDDAVRFAEQLRRFNDSVRRSGIYASATFTPTTAEPATTKDTARET